MHRIVGKIRQVVYLAMDYLKVLTAPRQAVYLLGAPSHSNLGDQAQTYCAKLILAGAMDLRVVDLTAPSLLAFNGRLLKLIQGKTTKDSLIVLHSGYHMTDIYELENRVILLSLRLFRDNRILILPQTINYTNSKYSKQMKEAIEAHADVVLMCRDEVSYAFANENFEVANILLYPDIVSSLIGVTTFESDKKGILLCFRNDAESKYGSEVKTIRDSVCDLTDTVGQKDTTITMYAPLVTLFRRRVLGGFWRAMSEYRLVITDRYHGTIFSIMTGTPVIVMGSTDHKLSSGVKWFPKDIFSKYVKYANSVDEAVNLAHEVYKEQQSSSVSPSYFRDKYWSPENIKKIINKG